MMVWDMCISNPHSLLQMLMAGYPWQQEQENTWWLYHMNKQCCYTDGVV